MREILTGTSFHSMIFTSVITLPKLYSPAFPTFLSTNRTTLSTDYPARKRVDLRAISIESQSQFLHVGIPSFQFKLCCFPLFFWNDCFVALFYIKLLHFPMILFYFLGKEICCISFLQKGITHIFFIFQNRPYRCTSPFFPACTSLDMILHQHFCNSSRIIAIQKLPINSLHYFCLFLIYNQLPIITFIISQEILYNPPAEFPF